MNELFIIVLAALLPAFILLCYIFRKDKRQPEPIGQIGKGVLCGVGSVACTFAISALLSAVGIVAPEQYSTFYESMRYAFIGAAIPEESAKLLMLWLLLRRNRYFDEHTDGIVYAVSVGMGFAAVENLIFLFGNYDNWVGVSVTRALFSVPAHFAFAVAMGYYYSLASFGRGNTRSGYLLSAWGVPVMLHGIFDTLLFCLSLGTALSTLLFITFFAFCYYMHRIARQRIHEHQRRDGGRYE